MITSVVSMPIDSRRMTLPLHHAHLPEADGLREQRFRSSLLILRKHGLEAGERRLDLLEAFETCVKPPLLEFRALEERGGGRLRRRLRLLQFGGAVAQGLRERIPLRRLHIGNGKLGAQEGDAPLEM